MRVIFFALLAVLSLAGCSGGGSPQQVSLAQVASSESRIPDNLRSLIYAYPVLGQVEVPLAAPVVLRFSHPLQPGADLTQLITIQPTVAACGSTAVPFTFTTTPDGQGAVLQPRAPLTPGVQYTVAGSAIPLVLSTGGIGTVNLQRSGMPPLTFTTRPALEGALQKLDPTCSRNYSFTVAAVLPDPNSFVIGVPNFAPIDYSSLRLQLTQPIDPTTVVYGSTVSLTSGGTLVPARVLVKYHDITIDPVADLDATKTYTLSLGAGIKSTFGASLNPGTYASYSFMPQHSGAKLNGPKTVVQVPTSGASILTGAPVNQVPVASPLLGQCEAGSCANVTNVAQAGGTMYADLSQPSQYANVLSMRVPRGNILKAAQLDVKLSGQVPAGLQTGDLTISLVSDANGVLSPNPYSVSNLAPSLVNLQLDMAMSAADPTSNGAFTQKIMHVQLAGIASTDLKAHMLNIDAVGTVDLKVLGVDNAVGVLAFKMQIDTLGTMQAQVSDTQAPKVQSWVPGSYRGQDGSVQLAGYNGLNGGEYVRPGDSLIVNFTKAMDEDSLVNNPGAVTLTTATGTAVPANLRVDGTALVVQPRAPLAQDGTSYVLTVNDHGGNGNVTDLAGNQLASDGVQWTSGATFSFQVPRVVNPTSASPARPPIVLSLYPGYPCPVASGTRNVAQGQQGQCAGGKTSDDVLPLPTIEQSKGLAVVFSQSMSAASIKLGTSCNASASFRVEQIDASGNCQQVVSGALQVSARGLQFVPDQRWTVGAYYRYVLGSNNDLNSATATCDGTQSLCGSNGLPLQTQMIAQETGTGSPGITNPQHGGPPMEIWFQGVADDLSGSVASLRVLPVHDVDANFRLDPGERLSYALGGISNSTAISSLTLNPANTCTTGMSSGGEIGTDNGNATTGRCVASNGALLQPDNTSLNPDGTRTSYYGAATSFALGCKLGTTSEVEGDRKGQQCQGNQFLLITSNLNAALAGYGQVRNPITGASITGIKVKVAPTILLTSGPLVYASLGISSAATSITSGLISAANSLGLGSIINPLTAFLNTGAGAINGILPLAVKDLTNSDVPAGAVFTGPLVFRMRYPAGSSYIPAVIQSVTDANGKPQLKLTTWLDLYLDIPELNANATIAGAIQAIQIKHKAFSNTNLSGNGCDVQQGDSPSSATGCNGQGTIEATGLVKFLPDGRLTVQLSNVSSVVRLNIPLSDPTGLLVGTLKVIVPKSRFIVDASLAPLKQ